jgi:hypothetical protein
MQRFVTHHVYSTVCRMIVRALTALEEEALLEAIGATARGRWVVKAEPAA